MSFADHFPVTTRIGRPLTGPAAGRVYVTISFVLFLTKTVVRVYSFERTRRIRAVISGLAKLEIDKTTEEEVLRTVPYLMRSKWDRQVTRNIEVGDVLFGYPSFGYCGVENRSAKS